ncbi:MAG TPA: VWA domain-containing protein [Planctomycetaceae bacterium]
MDAYRFYSQLWLLLVPVVLALAWWRFRPRRRPAAVFSSLADLKNLPVTLAQRLRRAFPYLYALALCLIIAGLARPQSGRSESRIVGQGIAIEIVLDISGSMEALDFTLEGENVSRLTAVKHVIRQFVLGSREQKLTGRPDDLIGLVAFGGFADSKCPLTLDHGALVDILQGLEIPKQVRDHQGRVINAQSLQEELATAIGDGVAVGVDRLRGAKAKGKVLVLLTDGDSNAGVVDPHDAARIAAESGIKLYTIGIGQNGIVPIPQEDEFGNRFLVQAQFKINEELLRDMAKTGGGRYFHAADSDGLAQVYAEIDKLEKTEFEETKYSEYTELFRWFAGTGLGLVFVIGILVETRFRSLP